MTSPETPQPPEPYMRKELTGHLWNDWYGVASELAYLTNPRKRRGYENATPEELKIVQGQFLHAVHEKIIAKFEHGGPIPKVDVTALSDDKKAQGTRYNELVERANSLLVQIRGIAAQLPLIQDDTGYPHHEIPENHEIFSLAAELKKIMIEVNELLYNKPCEFFD